MSSQHLHAHYGESHVLHGLDDGEIVDQFERAEAEEPIDQLTHYLTV